MYKPSDDSFFFAEFLTKLISKLKNKDLNFLDMGSGSGILALTALKRGIKNVLAVDINPETVIHLKKQLPSVVQSNLFSKVKGKFDIIVFNAPYLPRDKDEPKESQLETTGGKLGDEISLRFLKQAKKHINKSGKIYLLVSSLTPLERINKFKPKIVAKKKIWFEELLILEFCS